MGRERTNSRGTTHVQAIYSVRTVTINDLWSAACSLFVAASVLPQRQSLIAFSGRLRIVIQHFRPWSASPAFREGLPC